MDKFAELFDKHISTLTESIAKLGPDATRVYQDMVGALALEHMIYSVMSLVALVVLPFLGYLLIKKYENTNNMVDDMADDVWPIFAMVACVIIPIVAFCNLTGNVLIAFYPEQHLIKTFLQ